MFAAISPRLVRRLRDTSVAFVPFLVPTITADAQAPACAPCPTVRDRSSIPPGVRVAVRPLMSAAIAVSELWYPVNSAIRSPIVLAVDMSQNDSERPVSPVSVPSKGRVTLKCSLPGEARPFSYACA